jgi:serine protease Do
VSALIANSRDAVVAIHAIFPSGSASKRGIGTGFVLRSDGLVLTSRHVIAGAEKIRVKLNDLKRRLPAKVVGQDSLSDLALLRVFPPHPLSILSLGNSDSLQLGEWVIVLGYPYGRSQIATKGIVSGKGRVLLDLDPSVFSDFIQTDALIQKGNSGGPLLNLSGQVVGVVTRVNRRAHGIGFAVPVNLVKAMVAHLHTEGRLVRSVLGLSVDSVDWELAQSMGMDRSAGVVVNRVRSDGPAHRAGFLPADVIIQINATSVTGRADLSWRVATWPVGQPMPVRVIRKGQKVELVVTPERAKATVEQRVARKPNPRLPAQALCLKVAPLSEKPARLVKSTGVVVVDLNAVAASHGIRMGDVIVELNNKPIASKKQLNEQLDKAKTGTLLRFYLARQRESLFVAIRKTWP